MWSNLDERVIRQEKGTQIQTFWSGYLRVAWGREGVRVKKFEKTFWRDIRESLAGCAGESGGPKGGHLKGGYLKMGFRSEVCT